MNFRRNLIILLVVVMAIAGGIFLYRAKIRGLLPAVFAPKEDIAELIAKSKINEENIIRGDDIKDVIESPLQLPADFEIEIFAKDLPGARVLAQGPNSTLWLSQTSEGVISRLQLDGNSVIEQKAIYSDLNQPHGLVFDYRQPEMLYFAEVDGVYRVNTTLNEPAAKIFDLPAGDRHFTRTLAWHPDGRLMIAIGSSCDVCQEKDERYAAIMAINRDGSNPQIIARGLRNAVFMATHPVTGELWVTEMGRDNLGDDLPPDEINIITEGGNYGWPLCYGQNIYDSKFDKNVYVRNPCTNMMPAYLDLPAHSAPLGLAFIPEEGWPEEYWYDLLVAYHGSWNRSVPTGYKIARIKLDANGVLKGGDLAAASEDFISGWLQDEKNALGRPVDLLIQPGGILYITDDKAGVIYRVTYKSSEDIEKQREENIEKRLTPIINDDCVVSGCNGEICDVVEFNTICDYQPEYACYQSARCERQENGTCNWTMTTNLFECLDNVRI